MKKNVRKIGLKGFVRYYKPVKYYLLLSIILSILTGLASVAFPYFSTYVTSMAEKSDFDSLTIGLALMAGIILLRILFTYIIIVHGHIMGAKMEIAMRKEALEKMHKLETSNFDRTPTGAYISRVVTDLNDIPEFAHHSIEDFITGIVIFIGGFYFAFTNSIIMGAALFGIFLLGVIFSYWRQRNMKERRLEIRSFMSKISAFVGHQVDSVAETKSYAAQKFEQKRFQKMQNELLNKRSAFFKAEAKMFSGNILVIFSTTFLATALGTYFVAKGQITLPQLIGLTAAASILVAPMNKFVAVYSMLSLGLSAIERFDDFMLQPEEVVTGKKEAPIFKGEIVFKNVSFSYMNKEQQKISVLSNFNLEIKSGQKVGLVGETGIGKSTIFKILLRFYDIDSGDILIDGVSIYNYTINSLRKQFGYIQQNPVILDDTIKNNIIYGKSNATNEEIEIAAKRAKIDDVIENLINGYETIAGTKGAQLSGGQKQRVAIARAFLADSSIIMLDEATSALDNKTEKEIKNSVEKLSKNKTTIVIAHRLTTIKNMNRVIVMGKNGVILEDGTHDQLMKNKEYYYNLNTM